MSHIIGDDVNSVGWKTGRHFMNKKQEILQSKMSEFETESKNMNIGDLHGHTNQLKKLTSLKLTR
jgi:hypothetical protein